MVNNSYKKPEEKKLTEFEELKNRYDVSSTIPEISECSKEEKMQYLLYKQLQIMEQQREELSLIRSILIFFACITIISLVISFITLL